MSRRGVLALGVAFVLAASVVVAGGSGAGAQQSPPGQVSSVSLSRADGLVIADWPAVSGATKYHVAYSTDGGGSWHAPVDDHTNVSTNSLTFVADNAKTYVVGVRAGNDVGWGGWRNSPAAGPFVPPVQQLPPGQVSSVSLSRADGLVIADWPAVSGATKYHVAYSTDGGGSWHAPVDDHTNVSTNSLTFVADNAKTYVVAVRAGNDVGWGDWRNSAALGPVAPYAPKALLATAGDASVTLSWDDPQDSSITGYEYNVNHNATSTGNFSGWGPWTSMLGSGAGTTSFTISGLVNGREYRYHVRAVNDAGTGAVAPDAAPWFVSAVPQEPQEQPELEASGATSNTMTLTLTNYAAPWYYTYQAAGGAGSASGGAASACSDEVPLEYIYAHSLSASTAYTFTAYRDDQCQTPVGAQATGTTTASPANGQAQAQSGSPPPPPEAVYVYRHCDDMWFGYHTIPEASGYDINASRWNKKHWNRIGTDVMHNWWWVLNSKPHKTYHWAVRSRNASGHSAWTDSPAAPPAPCPPTNVQARWITNGIEVSWTPGKRTTAYDLAYSADGGATWTDIASGITGDDPDDGAGLQSASNNTGQSNDVTYEWSGADRSKTYIFSVRPEYHGVEGEWTHAPPPPGSRKPAEEFNNLYTEDPADIPWPTGIWSDGTTMWVADNNDDKIYAYNMSGQSRGQRDSSKDFTLDSVNNNPAGIWSDGATMWVADDKIYAYNMSGQSRGQRDSSKEFDNLIAGGVPSGIWSDGTTMWVADVPNKKLFAYKMSDKSRDSSKDFTLDSDNENPVGIWSDGATMWVADNGDDKIYAYKMWEKSRDSSKEFDNLIAVGNTVPSGIWSDGTTMWVADEGSVNPDVDGKLYAYYHTTPQPVAPQNVQPQNVQVARTDKALSISWTQCDVTQASCNGGQTVNNFHIDLSSDGGSTWVRAKTLASYTSGSAVSLTRGINNAAYKARIRVENSAGGSAFTEVDVPALEQHMKNYSAQSVHSTGIGIGGQNQVKVAASFKTGPNPGGYTLKTATAVLRMEDEYSAGLEVTLHQLDGDVDDYHKDTSKPQTAVLATLSGSAPTSTAWTDVAFTCPVGDSGCHLSPNSIYFVKIVRTGPEGVRYQWAYPGETTTTYPTLNGWVMLDDHYTATNACANKWCSFGDEQRMRLDFVANASPASLSASKVKATTATLTLASYPGQWWLKRTTPADTACTAQTTSTASLSSLTGGTAYTYGAYSDSACTAAVAQASFTTPYASHNLDGADNATVPVGHSGGSLKAQANSFRTGNHSGGYTLQSVTVRFAAKTGAGSPGNIVVAIHAHSNNAPDTSAMYTLSGDSTPDTAGDYTYTCSSGCDLVSGATYFLVLSAPDASGGNAYNWSTTSSTDTSGPATPIGFGFDIRNVPKTKTGTGDWTNTPNSNNNPNIGKFRLTYVPN